MQRLTIIGNLGKDAEVKNFNGKNVINFSVAVTENWKDKDGNKQSKAYWYECSRWAENTNISQYLKKGCKVLAEGVPEPRAYIGQDGQAKAVQGVRITNIHILNFVEDNSQPVNTTQPTQNYNQGSAVDSYQNQHNNNPSYGGVQNYQQGKPQEQMFNNYGQTPEGKEDEPPF